MRLTWGVSSSVLLVILAPVFSACGSDSTTDRVLAVPLDYPTIQSAVDESRPGDVVLVDEGTYNESVLVDTPRITIRGVDRNNVILDGRYELPNGFEVTANGVAVENLTVHSYRQNGVLVSGAYSRGPDDSVTVGTTGNSISGYSVSFVTAYNNGLYGVYAFASQDGLIEDVYVSGHPDSGIYVGQCKPCNTIVRRVTATNNAIGYFGTNASGNVWVVESRFVGNRLGIAPNSQSTEKLAPQEDAVIAGNLVADNDNPDAPEIKNGFFSGGIVVGAGNRNTVARNRVEKHSWAGIAVMPLNSYRPENNVVRDNVLSDNGMDLVYVGEGGDGNCFVGNSYARSTPNSIESVLPCGSSRVLESPAQIQPASAPIGPDYRTLAPPPAQTTMPDPASRPWTDASGPSSWPIIDDIRVPDAD